MANSGALIKESIWRDRDFRCLPRQTQCTYMQLCAQKELDCAGLLSLNLPLLAKGCEEITVDDLENDLAVLEERRFVFVDYDTFEVFVRAKMRSSEVWRSPNVMRSALKSARMVASPKIRREVASELRRLRRAVADEVADELEPFRKGSERVSEPPSLVSVLVSESPSVGGYLGRARPECRRHEQNADGKCRDCMKRRLWDEENEAALKADELDLKRRQRALADNCPVCQGTNWIPDTDPAVKCDHQAVQHA